VTEPAAAGWPDRLRRALAGSRPAEDEYLSLGGLGRTETLRHLHLVPPNPTPAAVLIPILNRPEGLSLLLTQRSAALKHHAGQVAFPGGRTDAADASPLQTALREAEEEIGLDRSRVDVLGYLGDHLILTGYRVTPVVALVDPQGELRLDAGEVDAVFELPLTKAFDSSRYHARSWSMGGEHVRFFDLYHANRRIWGATAGMIASLARRVGVWTDPT
jgi:8-oxo-dGTP pyrophosphatase MutT (NUDIX family)